jgi:hypothetical protein
MDINTTSINSSYPAQVLLEPAELEALLGTYPVGPCAVEISDELSSSLEYLRNKLNSLREQIARCEDALSGGNSPIIQAQANEAMEITTDLAEIVLQISRHRSMTAAHSL